ncbi:MAG: fimbria/pilus outer membrane usher protein, partial [Candidatus Velthaea sp.]
MARRRISNAVVAAAVLSLAAQAAAPATARADAGPAAPSADGRTFATLVVNHEARGEYVIQIKGGDVFVKADDLRTAGVVVPSALPLADGYVRIRDLAPAVATLFDADGPVVRLDAVDARALAHHSTVALSGRAPEGAHLTNERSGYLNYSVRDATGGTWSGAQELAFSDAAKTLYSSGSFDARGFRRGLTNVTWDNPANLRRVVAGDTFADSGDLGSTLLIAGVSVAKSYGLNPYDSRASSPVVYGSVLAPSTAEVRVNGQLVRTVDLPPGTFDLRNLPASGGLTDASIVVRDAFGRTQVFSARYYGAAAVLKQGSTDYAYAVGAIRDGAGSAVRYAGVAALGRYAVGITAATTLGAHAELAGGLENAGAGIDHAGRFGVTHVGLAQSRFGAGSGIAASFGHTFGTSRVWGTAALQAATPGYTTVAQRSLVDRETLNAQLSIGVRPFKQQYTSTYSVTETHTLLAGRTREVTWGQTLPLAGGASLYVNTGMARARGTLTPSFSLLLQRPLGRSGHTTVNESVSSDGTGTHAVTEVRRSSPTALGLQYDARL